MTNDWLTFELSPDGDEVEIRGDPEGLRRLVGVLQRLITSNRSGHEHLATLGWAGSELLSEAQVSGRLVDQVTNCWVR